MSNGYRRWFSDKLDNVPKGDNSLMNEQVMGGIRNAVRTYMALYQNPNDSRIEAWSYDLYDTGYSPAQIKSILEDIKNTETKMVSVAEVRSKLSVTFPRSRVEAEKTAQRIEERIKGEIERFKNQREHFIKQSNEETYYKFVNFYLENVFPGAELGEYDIENWGRIALKDFYDAECDFNRAVELGNQRADREYLERKKP